MGGTHSFVFSSLWKCKQAICICVREFNLKLLQVITFIKVANTQKLKTKERVIVIMVLQLLRKSRKKAHTVNMKIGNPTMM